MSNLMTADKFLALVAVQGNGCWLWQGHRDKNGYGRVGRGWAHRRGYQMLVGEIPPGLDLDHLCKTPACVNPAHLEPVTHRENMLRGDRNVASMHARSSTFKCGHPKTSDHAVTWRGARQCNTCRKAKKTADYHALADNWCKPCAKPHPPCRCPAETKRGGQCRKDAVLGGDGFCHDHWVQGLYGKRPPICVTHAQAEEARRARQEATV